VTFTGRLTEQKRPDRFKRIADRLASLKQDCRFKVYGSGELRSLFPNYDSHYDVKGPLSWENRGEAYRNSSAILVTSQSEPFGMVILEAMQHHVPVFYPVNSGAAEVLNSGFKIDPDDTDAVAFTLKNLLENWELWENTVEQQMESVKDHMAQKYELILTGVWDRVHKKQVA
jgi:glycosyltransferase involved in cell wall biosynthesis